MLIPILLVLLSETDSPTSPFAWLRCYEEHVNRNGIKLKAFAKDYISRHAKQHKKSWLQDERRLDKYVLPALGNHQLQSIRKVDIVRLHHEITTAGTPVEMGSCKL